MKLKTGDYAIAAIILLCSLLLFALFSMNKQTAVRAEVLIDGQLVKTFALKQNVDEYVTIKQNSLQFQVHLKNGKIAITDIDCPDHICVKTGYIGKSGQSIICLPNRVIIKTVGNQASGEVDIVAK